MRTLSVITEIGAPPHVVWAALTDLAAFSEWNPFITSADGELKLGSRLAIRIQPPGGRPMTFRPSVRVLEDGRRLEWLGRLGVPGIFDGRHSFELTALPDGGTRLVQAETFSGVLVPLLGRTLERTREGFALMNEALRERAEAAAADVGTAPTEPAGMAGTGGVTATAPERLGA
ncbi:hypothetical protein ATJ97_2045 [Georgenia soli]|uniref:Polyketide cyclase/dehydrase/lipid transport protein n=1 Tax=Georgenia soli TaxID=638953 RepID=A0A2A9EMU7_9MICO|nr:SRPBCC domain-containing protein [Georgenia soli]PFG39539.1 hypothetical protein ATJ97_2045 [Georgenia soli]